MPPAWFDEAYYGQQKVIQMNGLGYEPAWLAAHGATQWDFALYEQYLAAYRLPDGGSVTAWDNFLACNGANYGPDIDARQLNISCNPLFDPAWYCQSLVDWANESGYASANVAAGKWTVATMSAHVLTDLGLSLWEHFKTFGLREQINPSADFNTHAYLVARAEAMSAPGHAATVDDAIAALLAEDANPVMDYASYGQAHGIELQPVEMPAETPAQAAPVAPVRPPVASAAAPGASSGSAAPSAPDTPVDTPDSSGPQPNVPTGPAGPADPDEPANPVDPSGPGEPTDPAEPEEPDEPSGPADPADPEEPADPSAPDEPGDSGDPADNPWHIVIEQQGNVTVPPIASQGEDIDVYVDATGLVAISSLNALGSGVAGDVSLTIPNGHLGNGNATTVIRGENIDVDLGGAAMPVSGDIFAFPRLELWAQGTVSMLGSNQSDWVSLRKAGAGQTEISLDDEEDIFELYDLSSTCAPAAMPRDADLHINLGDCWDQLYIGDLAVEGNAIQTIHVDLGNDMTRETISLGRVTAGKLVLSLEHPSVYDEITTRRDLAPKSFQDGEDAAAALGAFGIDADDAELGVWHDRVRQNGLVEKAYSGAAIYANDNAYVIYGNVLVEMIGLGPDDFADA